MGKRIIILSMIMLMIAVPFIVAKGGGGGESAAEAKAPDCTEDVYDCTSFGECQPDGTQSRTCTKTFECESANTPQPSETESCAYVSQALASLPCAGLDTRRDRVVCRIQQSPYDQQKELELAFSPEECVALSGAAADACVTTYKQSQPCWQKAASADRVACLRDMTNTNDIAARKSACGSDSACLTDLREDVYAMIKLRFYELEQQAELMYAREEISKDQVIDIVLALEEQKIAFNEASSKAERQGVILKAKGLWNTFLEEVA